MKRGKATKLAIALSLALVMGSGLVSNSVFAAKASTAGVLTQATFSDPINLCPSLSLDSASTDTTKYIFSGLLNYDWKGNLIADCAAAMPVVSKDGKTITFKLRKDVKWHDGKQMTSADVKFSYEFILNKKAASPRYGDFEKITSIETPDAYTVVFKMSQVDSTVMAKFANPYIIPKHLWEDVDPAKAKENALNRKPIGNGPYKFVEWKTSERVVLEANPDYYGGKPKVKTIIQQINGNQAVAMVKAETGEANYVKVPESDITRMKTKSNLNVFVYDRAAFDAIVYNTKSPFFGDKRVRQAITSATNKTAIVKGIYKGIAKVAEGSYNPKNYAYEPNVTKFAYDIKKANALLDAAGWKRGADGIRVKDGKKFEFALLTNKGNIMREKLTVVLQAQLKLIGIKVEPRLLEWNTFLAKYVDIGKFDAYVGGFTTSLEADQTAFWNSNRALGSLNKGSYVNKTIDKCLEDAKLTYDVNEQKRLYSQIQKILADEQPMTFICFRREGLALNKDVKNARTTDLLGTNGEELNWTIN
jgi:peptide/nickel transport system substrate-binding protein